MARLLESPGPAVGGGGTGLLIIGVVIIILVLIGSPLTVIPAGHGGVKAFFGNVSSTVIPAGVHFVLPFTRVVKMSIKTQELKEAAEVPSKEGLTMDLEGSLLFRLDPEKAPDIYRTIGPNYAEIAVVPQIRSASREITATCEAKALYSAERDKIARETFELFSKMSLPRGIIGEAVLLRKIGLPAIVANAIQEKLKREQEAEQMKFVLQKEEQDANRNRIERPGSSDSQKILAVGLSPMVLEWKGIEATERRALSQN